MNSHLCSRRHFLQANSFGLGSLALAWLLKQDHLLGAPVKPFTEAQKFDLLPKPTHFPPRAKAMISLMMMGGPSHLDLFDPAARLDVLARLREFDRYLVRRYGDDRILLYEIVGGPS